MRFAIFPLHLCRVLRLPRKIDARSYEVLHLSRKIISANLKIWYSKMQPLSGNQRPDLRTSLMNMSFVLHLPREMHLWRSSSNAPRLPSFLEMLQNPHVLPTFDKVHNPLRRPHETTSERPKVARTCGVLYILTSKRASRHNGIHFFDIATSKSGPELVWKCASRHNGVHFFHISTSKSRPKFCTFWLRNVLRATTACTCSTSQLPRVVPTWGVLYILTSKCASRHNGMHLFHISASKSGPNVRCFVHFDFEMCFVPQRRALAPHLSFQKWSEREVFCTFWLRNVLRATTACTCSTSQLPKVVRTWGVLYILTSKCASCHNGVHVLDISTPKSGPSMVCFVHFDFEICFAPQRCALFHLSSGQLAHPRHRVQRASWPCLFHLTPSASAQSATSLQGQWEKATGTQGSDTWAAFPHAAGLCRPSWQGGNRDQQPPPAATSQQPPRTRRFGEPTFRPSGATNHWKKHSVSRLSYLFAHLDLLSSEAFSFLIFFLLFSSLTLPSALHLSILSEVWLLNFLRLHIIYALSLYIYMCVCVIICLYILILWHWSIQDEDRTVPGPSFNRILFQRRLVSWWGHLRIWSGWAMRGGDLHSRNMAMATQTDIQMDTPIVFLC